MRGLGFHCRGVQVGLTVHGPPALRRPLRAFSADRRRGGPTNLAAFGPFKLLFLSAGKQRVVIKRCAEEHIAARRCHSCGKSDVCRTVSPA